MAKKATGKTNEERAQEALQNLLDIFEGDQLPDLAAKAMIARRSGLQIPQHTWSLSNQILALLAGTTDGRTFGAWKRLGRYPRKGTQAFWILEPRMVMIPLRDGDGKPVLGDDGQPRRISRLIGFSASPRFRVEDTDGDPLPEPADYTPEELPALHHLAETLGIRVVWGPSLDSSFGSYTPAARIIQLHTYHPATFWHELAHAADDRLGNLKIKSAEDLREAEVVAEAAACALAVIYGQRLDWDGRRYIEGWAGGGQDARTAIARVMARVQRVLEFLLDLDQAEPSRAAEEAA